MPAAAIERIPYAEYLRIEASTEERHEFFDGVVLAMAGGTMAHAKVKINLTMAVGTRLRGGPCQPYDADQRIRVAATSLATYPDLSVVCGPRLPDVEDRNAATNPTVLFEVLSPSTEAYDRGEKFAQYRRLPTLRHYVLVASQRIAVEVFSLNEHGRWELAEYGAGEQLALSAVGIEINVDELYEGWEPDSAAAPVR